MSENIDNTILYNYKKNGIMVSTPNLQIAIKRSDEDVIDIEFRNDNGEIEIEPLNIKTIQENNIQDNSIGHIDL